jgi:hypothetical protein
MRRSVHLTGRPLAGPVSVGAGLLARTGYFSSDRPWSVRDVSRALWMAKRQLTVPWDKIVLTGRFVRTQYILHSRPTFSVKIAFLERTCRCRRCVAWRLDTYAMVDQINHRLRWDVSSSIASRCHHSPHRKKSLESYGSKEQTTKMPCLHFGPYPFTVHVDSIRCCIGALQLHSSEEKYSLRF